MYKQTKTSEAASSHIYLSHNVWTPQPPLAPSSRFNKDRENHFSQTRECFSQKRKTLSHPQFISFLPENKTNSTFLSRSTSFSSWAGFYWNQYAAKKPIFSFWVDWLWDLLENETRNICTIAKHHICASKIFVKIQTLLLSTL